MDVLNTNIERYLKISGRELNQFLEEYNVAKVVDLKLSDLQQFCLKENLDLVNLMSYSMFVDQSKLQSIQLLILDVDGVMTDAGMYFTENGDQIKKYNAKDGMAIRALDKFGIQVGIISSGFKLEVVKARADLLKIEHLYVGRDPKMEILTNWCEKLGISFDEVGIIGDDINDLDVMKNVGFSASPADAVPVVKEHVDLVLQKKGGEGCVREFIDYYLLKEPLCEK
jgi:YrbI family 3-deoxy-D-manno-octulosonate 8-phosphate phosphatase